MEQAHHRFQMIDRDSGRELNNAIEVHTVEGREEGREEGLEIGLERGKLTGIIQTLQGLLGDRTSADAELIGEAVDELRTKIDTLKQRLRDRQA